MVDLGPLGHHLSHFVLRRIAYDAFTHTHAREFAMFWIVHLFALLLFWPALFLTVPLHIISKKM